MKKRIQALLLALTMSFSFVALAACGETENTNDDNTNTEQGGSTEGGNTDNGSTDNGNTDGGSTDNGTTDEELETTKLPTKEAVISARKSVANANVQGYDFTVNFGGTVTALGVAMDVEANYEGKYRYDKTTNDLKFQRTTSGILLYDSTAYVYTNNDKKMEVEINEKNEVKKVAVLPTDDEDTTFISETFVSIVDALEVENLGEIEACNEVGFAYQTNMYFDSDNFLLDKLCEVLEGLGTSISLKDVTVSNPFGGIQLLFNLTKDNKLEDFQFTADISFPINETEQTFTLTYAQNGANSTIVIPSIEGVIVDNNQISAEVAAINASIADLKNDEDYSLDLLAENEFDPAWNKLATVDRYTGRLYKNTDDEDSSNVWFNHSYKYKSHTEEDGAENFEFALGNLQNGDVYLASYKGSNTYTLVTGKTVDTQFDYMVAPALQTATNIDCIKKVVDGTKTTYSMYLNESGTAHVQDYILDMINSNTATGVTKVENYLNSDYIVKEAEVVVEVVDGKVATVKCLTELKYCPTGGEYTEYNITLTNTIELKINDKLSAAQKYTAPSKPDGFIDNLESIL